MGKKSIAFFTTSLKKGGAERVVSILSNNLLVDYNVIVILLKSGIEYEISPKVKIIVIDFSFRKFIKSIFKLNNAIKKYKVEKIVTFLYQPSFIALVCRMLFGWNSDIIVSERTYTLSHYKKGTFKGILGLFFVKWLYNKADLLMPNSKLTAYSLRNDLNIKVPISVLYNPIELVHSGTLNSHRVTKPIKILNVGNNYWYKNQKILIEALELLKDYEWELTIIGSGPLNLELRNLVTELRLDDRITFIENVNAYDHYTNHDLFISTSLIEGFPNSIVEAMSAGLAIISTDCKSGPREILAPDTPYTKTLNNIDDIEYSTFGIIIPISNKIRLAESIVELLNNTTLLDNYKNIAKARAQDFNYKSIINNFKKIIEYES